MNSSTEVRCYGYVPVCDGGASPVHVSPPGRRTFLSLFRPTSQQIGVEFVHQRDRGHRHTGPWQAATTYALNSRL